MANKNNKGKGIGTVAAGVAGLAVGAAATATAVALSNKKNRVKLAKTINNFKKQGRNVVTKLEDGVREIKKFGKNVKKAGLRAREIVSKEKSKSEKQATR